MTDDLAWLDATAQADLVRRGEVSPQELVDAAVSRIDKVDGELHSVIHRRFDEASREAGGDLPDGPFRGVPFLVKDLYAASAGDPMHNGTRVLRDANYVAPADSWLVGRYRRRRVRHRRAHEHTGVRARAHDRTGVAWRDPQSLEPRSHARRVERGERCG